MNDIYDKRKLGIYLIKIRITGQIDNSLKYVPRYFNFVGSSLNLNNIKITSIKTSSLYFKASFLPLKILKISNSDSLWFSRSRK